MLIDPDKCAVEMLPVFTKRCHEAGVDAKVHYPLAIHQQPAFADLDAGPLPVTEKVVSEMMSLPVSPELTDEQRGIVIEALDVALTEVGS